MTGEMVEGSGHLSNRLFVEHSIDHSVTINNWRAT
jgi:hypothetical protein